MPPKTGNIILCEKCGSPKWVYAYQVKMGRGRFCSSKCANSGITASKYKHGHTWKTGQSKEYNAWMGMKQRTTNPNSKAYHHYGGRGIAMCDRWFESFASFLEDVGLAPSPDHSIDRIDNDGNYEPGNVRWATQKMQTNNRRNNRLLTFQGQSHNATEWSKRLGISRSTIEARIRLGWNDERILTSPVAHKTKGDG